MSPFFRTALREAAEAALAGDRPPEIRAWATACLRLLDEGEGGTERPPLPPPDCSALLATLNAAVENWIALQPNSVRALGEATRALEGAIDALAGPREPVGPLIEVIEV